MAIFNDYVFGQLNQSGELQYFTPYCGCLKATTVRRGKTIVVLISNPTEAQMNAAGWYRVINVDEVGEDNQVGNIIYHYTGMAIVEDDKDDDTPTDETTEE